MSSGVLLIAKLQMVIGFLPSPVPREQYRNVEHADQLVLYAAKIGVARLEHPGWFYVPQSPGEPAARPQRQRAILGESPPAVREHLAGGDI